MHAPGGLEGLGPLLSTGVFSTVLSKGDRECVTTCNGEPLDADDCAGEMSMVRARLPVDRL